MPPEVWAQARKALVFYFERRQRSLNAEDLAQDTLMALWRRSDYYFEHSDDFLRVCHGFAARVLKHDLRQARRGAEFTVSVDGPPDSVRLGAGLEQAELIVLLNEVYQAGRTLLRKSDWELIEEATHTDPGQMNGVQTANDANRLRVRLSRARARLVRVTKWRESSQGGGNTP